MIPDYQYAARRAREISQKYGTNDPLDVIKKQPNILIMTFRGLSEIIGVDREKIVNVCGEDNQDAVTTVKQENGKLRYFVMYNQELDDWQIRSCLARELGHIAMNHDGSRPENVRQEEALCFAYHFICGGNEK